MRTDHSGRITRRRLLEAAAGATACGVLASARGPAAPGESARVNAPQAAAPEFDLLLKGGHVIDPANGLNAPRDLAVTDGKIAAVAESLPVESARKVVNVSGLYVAPGFIDLHAHCDPVAGKFLSLFRYPPHMNLASGATTIVDAGTWGAEDFDVFKRDVIDRSFIRILAFLNIVAKGMGPDLDDPQEQDVTLMDPARCAETIKRNRGILVGVKAAHYWQSKPWDAAHQPWANVDRAVEAGRLAEVPVMVDFWPRPPERSYSDLILKKLRPGDIHTHVFAQQNPILDENGKVHADLKRARERGVIFDLGHGAGGFWFRNAAPAIKDGFVPDTISTDLYLANVNGPVVDLITTMSKIHALGVPLEEVVRRVTANPAKVIRRDDLGTLTVGREADIAVFERLRGRFSYTDCGWTKMLADVKLENRMTIFGGGIAYDPAGLSMVEWQKAPPQYFTVPRTSNPVTDPPAIADPDILRQRLEAIKKLRGHE
jgi:dihydroorotase